MKNQQPEETTYQTAWTELQKIVNDLQGGSVGIDELTNKIERAAELVRFCRERLRSTEDAVGRLGQ
ncbi:MAG: exodeoxyribonuclease VII small subunit [Saprospiraceae bacterium]|nr:exodeoxyribonuclease VII small subunit [Saprospiraceae bacterium]